MDTGWTDRNKEKLAYMIFNQLDGLFVLISFAPVSLFLFLHPPPPCGHMCTHACMCIKAKSQVWVFLLGCCPPCYCRAVFCSLLAISSSTWSNRCIQRCRQLQSSSSSAVCPETLFLLQPLLRLHLKSFPSLYGKDSKIRMVLLTVKEENCCHLQGAKGQGQQCLLLVLYTGVYMEPPHSAHAAVNSLPALSITVMSTW